MLFILSTGHGVNTGLELQRIFREQAVSSGFVVDEWEASTRNVSFLDISITIRRDGGLRYLELGTHWKLSSLGVPLSADSAQLVHVHKAWRFSELRRIASTCSTFSIFLRNRGIFLSRLARYEEFDWLAELLDYDPYTMNKLRRRQPSRTTDNSAAWIVLPGHPVWAASRRISSALREAMTGTMGDLLSLSFKGALPFRYIRSSWALAAKHLHCQLKRT